MNSICEAFSCYLADLVGQMDFSEGTSTKILEALETLCDRVETTSCASYDLIDIAACFRSIAV